MFEYFYALLWLLYLFRRQMISSRVYELQFYVFSVLIDVYLKNIEIYNH